MKLEDLQVRSRGLAENIERTTQSLYMLHGHKAEVDYQISELVKAQSEAKVEESPVPDEQVSVQ